MPKLQPLAYLCVLSAGTSLLAACSSNINPTSKSASSTASYRPAADTGSWSTTTDSTTTAVTKTPPLDTSKWPVWNPDAKVLPLLTKKFESKSFPPNIVVQAAPEFYAQGVYERSFRPTEQKIFVFTGYPEKTKVFNPLVVKVLPNRGMGGKPPATLDETVNIMLDAVGRINSRYRKNSWKQSEIEHGLMNGQPSAHATYKVYLPSQKQWDYGFVYVSMIRDMCLISVAHYPDSKASAELPILDGSARSVTLKF